MSRPTEGQDPWFDTLDGYFDELEASVTAAQTAATTNATSAAHTYTDSAITTATNVLEAEIAGKVTSVNGETGVVTLTAGDVGAAPTVHSHAASGISDSTTVGRALMTAADAAAARTATGAAADTAVVKLTGNQTVAGIKTFSSAPVVPDNSFAPAKINGLLDGDGLIQIGLVPKSTDPTGDTMVQRRSSGTVAVATATAADEATRLDQVQALVGTVYSKVLGSDLTSADATTYVTAPDLALTAIPNGRILAVTYTFLYEASATGGIQMRLTSGGTGITTGNWSVLGGWSGIALSPTLTTTPSTSESYNRRCPIRFGSAINSDAGTQATISATMGGLGIGTPVWLWAEFRVQYTGTNPTGVLQPEFRQKSVDGGNPTALLAHQSTATIAVIA